MLCAQSYWVVDHDVEKENNNSALKMWTRGVKNAKVESIQRGGRLKHWDLVNDSFHL